MTSADIAFLSFIMSEETLASVVKADPRPPVQTQRFALLVAELLKTCGEVNPIGFAAIQDFPISTRIIFGYERFVIAGNLAETLPFINAVFLKHLTRLTSLLFCIAKIKKNRVLVIHGLHLPYLLIGNIMKLLGMRVGILLTDEQGIVLPTDGIVRRAMKTVDRHLALRLARSFDFGIALSSGLAETYIPGRPAAVFPGVYSSEVEDLVLNKFDRPKPSNGKFRVLYFGGLSIEYGIKILLDSIQFLPRNIEVRVFGRGPLEDDARELSKIDDRIYFGGFVDIRTIAEEMAYCDLLINPRPADGQLAWLSSPSKLLEYAASGKPLLTTALPTIPTDALEHCLIIEQATSRCIADSIATAMNADKKMLKEKGDNFRREMRSRYSIKSLSIPLKPLIR